MRYRGAHRNLLSYVHFLTGSVSFITHLAYIISPGFFNCTVRHHQKLSIVFDDDILSIESFLDLAWGHRMLGFSNVSARPVQLVLHGASSYRLRRLVSLVPIRYV